MSRLPPWLVVVVVWAAIYLPALGSFEIKGEEGRRILPAIRMLETGDYLVPRVGSDIYFSKPPLVNWLVAASFRVFGHRNEWTARLPSVLCLLAVAIAFLTVARSSLGRNGSMIAALIWLTSAGMIEKGRLIEIEALYVSLCALAIICWLSWWEQKRSPWLTWTVPWIFLGLGWLAKGPVILVFFYAVVLAVLWTNRQWKQLFHPAHFIGVAIMLAIFAAWAVPFLQLAGQERVLRKWSAQFTGRATAPLHFRIWITTIPRALGQFLPWILFVPFLRFRRFGNEHRKNLAGALAWAAAVPLIGIGLIPGAAPRYTLPVVTPFCWLMALAFVEDAFTQPAGTSSQSRPLWSRLGLAIVAVMAAGALIAYPIAARVMKGRQKIENLAARFNQVVPKNETVYVVDPNYQPFLFYARPHLVYVDSLEGVPIRCHYLLVRPGNEQEAVTTRRWSPHRAEVLLRLTDYRKETVILLKMDGR